MTPEAVIHRYLQVANQSDVDLEVLARLVATDADLLGRWLALLQVPAHPTALLTALKELDPWPLNNLAQAQAWAVLPVAGSARLSLDQWQAVLKAACLGEVLAEHVDMPRDEAVRMKVLLAISGVNLDHDPALTELIAFRGIRSELLEDAGQLQKIFSIVDVLELHNADQAALAASELLRIPPKEFADLVEEAAARSVRLMNELGLMVELDADWSERLWVQQQVSMLSNLFTQGGNLASLYAAHCLITRSLFGSIPFFFTIDEDGHYLLPMDGNGLRIAVASTSSSIAHAVRESAATTIADDPDVAVADRQVLRRLAVEDALVVPLVASDVPLGALVFEVDQDVDNEFGMSVYADELAKRLAAGRRDASGTGSAMERYRTLEEKRLGEIVHEANNPLSIVQNYLHILEMRLKNEPSLVEQLTMIGQEVKRAADIFQKVRDQPALEVVHPGGEGRLTDFDLTSALRRSVELHRGYAEDRFVTLVSELLYGEVSVTSDENKLLQVLSNLMRNAIEACRQGDQVTVTDTLGVFREGREGVEISVRDTGPGLSRDVLEKLFDPKRTTKGSDHSGLGLHIVGRLVGELRGGIDVRTSESEGTTFTLFLPL